MRIALLALLCALAVAGCDRWDAKAPDETSAGQSLETPPPAVIRAELSVSTRQFEADLLARYRQEPLYQGETPWFNEHLHTTKKSIEQRLVDYVVTPYKAAECVVRQVPRTCVRRVWENCLRRFRLGRCAGAFVNVSYACPYDVRECTPEIKAVIESRLTPVEVFKDEIAPTELRVRYTLNLRGADIDALAGGLKVKANVRLNLNADVKQGLLGESVTVKGALACASDLVVTATAKTIVNPGPALDIALTDFGIDADKVCIPGAVELVDVAMANPATYVTRELLGPPLKKVILNILNKQLDEQLSDDLNFQEDLTRAAEKIRDPIRLGSRDLWLRVNPSRAQISQFGATGSGDTNRLTARVAIVASPDVTFGAKPPATEIKKPFPVDVGDNPVQDFQLNVQGVLPLKEAASLTKAELQKALDKNHPDAPLIVDNVRIYQNGARFVLGVTFAKRQDSKAVGTVYLAATPYLETQERILRLKDVQFDVDSRRVLLKVANWLLSGLVETVIEREAQFAYGGPLAEIEKAAGLRATEPPDTGSLATEAISITQTGHIRHQAKDLMLIGKLHGVDVSRIWIANDAIRLLATANGRLDLHFRPRI